MSAQGLVEEDLRLLQAERDGVPHDHQVTFLGVQYPVRSAGLVALLRYASLKRGSTDQAQMAAAHRVLQECLDPEAWPAFQEAALAGKVTDQEIADVIQQIAEIHCARPWRTAFRLLGYAAGNLPELDGQLLMETGRGIGNLTSRELCNLVFARMLAACEDAEKRAELVEDLYLDFDPEEEARRKVMQMIADKERAGRNGDGSG